MDFSFSSEQDDLRREARAFLEANPSPSMEQLAELGWVGILKSDDFTFLDAAVIFEELGRALYDGPYVLNEVAGQPGDEVWSIEIDGFVPHLDKVTRVLTADMQGAGATGETLATVDESLGLGKLSRNGTEPAEGTWDDVRRRLLAALALESIGIGSKVTEMALAYVSGREQFGKKIGSYQAISHSLVDAPVTRTEELMRSPRDARASTRARPRATASACSTGAAGAPT
jgi:alkylation response protein AidB-like acyl-CoA dehydrogenase